MDKRQGWLTVKPPGARTRHYAGASTAYTVGSGFGHAPDSTCRELPFSLAGSAQSPP